MLWPDPASDAASFVGDWRILSLSQRETPAQESFARSCRTDTPATFIDCLFFLRIPALRPRHTLCNYIFYVFPIDHRVQPCQCDRRERHQECGAGEEADSLGGGQKVEDLGRM